MVDKFGFPHLLPAAEQERLVPCTFDVSQANGAFMQTYGMIDLKFEIGGRLAEQQIVVADIINEDGLYA